MEQKLYNTITEWAWINKLCVAEFIGYMAAFCGTVSLIPQIVKLCKERSAKAISATMYLIYTFGVVLWLIYGIMINSIPLIIAEIITLVLSTVILIMKYLWK
jgi:MtN3 and saliva related transmembrane protein